MLLTDFPLMLAYGIYFEAVLSQRQFNARCQLYRYFLGPLQLRSCSLISKSDENDLPHFGHLD
jgi:hypothetical protein